MSKINNLILNVKVLIYIIKQFIIKKFKFKPYFKEFIRHFNYQKELYLVKDDKYKMAIKSLELNAKMLEEFYNNLEENK